MMSAQGQEIVGPGYSVCACSDRDHLENRSMQRKEFPRGAAPQFRDGVTNQRCDTTHACIGGNRSNEEGTQHGEKSRLVMTQPEHVIASQGHTSMVKEFPRGIGAVNKCVTQNPKIDDHDARAPPTRVPAPRRCPLDLSKMQ
jgi:hypothetical protein